MSIARSAPKSIERVLEQIRSRQSEMSASQRLLADYILEKPYRVAFASTAQVAKELGVSSATVVRFGGFLGLGGFADLQDLARKAVAREASEVAQFKAMSSVAAGTSLLHKGIRADIESLERTGESIAEATFEKAVRRLAKARTVHVVGARSNYGFAHQLAYKLDLIGRPARLLSPGAGDLPEQLLQMQAGDVCLAITFPRFSTYVQEVLEHASTIGIPIVAITSSSLSYVSECAEILLPVAVRHASILESRVAALSVMNSLVAGISLLNPRTTAESMARNEALWAHMNAYVQEQSKRKSPFAPRVTKRGLAERSLVKSSRVAQ